MRSDHSSAAGGGEFLLTVSIELAAAKWKVALHDGQREKPAVHTVTNPGAAGRLLALLGLIESHTAKWSLPHGCAWQ